jgi:hypothetical protein
MVLNKKTGKAETLKHLILKEKNFFAKLSEMIETASSPNLHPKESNFPKLLRELFKVLFKRAALLAEKKEDLIPILDFLFSFPEEEQNERMVIFLSELENSPLFQLKRKEYIEFVLNYSVWGLQQALQQEEKQFQNILY